MTAKVPGAGRKGGRSDEERDIILEDPYRVRTINARLYEYDYAVLVSKLVEEKITLMDFLRVCVDSYINDEIDFSTAFAKFFRSTKKTTVSPNKKNRAALKYKIDVLEKKLLPPSSEQAEELYDVIEKKES